MTYDDDPNNEEGENRLLCAINRLNQRIEHMALVWERLEAKIAALKTVEDSVLALLKTFSQATKDAVANAKDLADAQVKIDALDVDFTARADVIAAAVVASTDPAVPAPPVVIDPITGLPVDPAAPVIDPTVPDDGSARSSRRR